MLLGIFALHADGVVLIASTLLLSHQGYVIILPRQAESSTPAASLFWQVLEDACGVSLRKQPC